MSEVAGPWLLACTINCLFILVVWYRKILLPVIAASKNLLKDEYRWEAERLEMREKFGVALVNAALMPESMPLRMEDIQAASNS